MKTHQKPTVKPTPNPPEPEKPDPAWCGFSNEKPTPTHTISTSTMSVASIVFHINSKKSLMNKIERNLVHQLFLDFNCSKAQQYNFNSKFIEFYFILLHAFSFFSSFDMTFIRFLLNTNQQIINVLNEFKTNLKFVFTKAWFQSIRLNISYKLMIIRVSTIIHLSKCSFHRFWISDRNIQLYTNSIVLWHMKSWSNINKTFVKACFKYESWMFSSHETNITLNFFIS